MYSLKDVAAGLYVSAAIRAGMLCTGKLVGRAIEVPHPWGHRSWLLNGRLHVRMFELHKAGVPMEHASAVLCAGGIKHLVLCQRLGTWEHRFVLQLLGPCMREFISSGEDKAAHLVVQSNLGPGLASAAAPVGWRDSIRAKDVSEVAPEFRSS